MRKNTCAGWRYNPLDHEIDLNGNGDAIGCHLKDGSQSWNCRGCRYRDSGELRKTEES